MSSVLLALSNLQFVLDIVEWRLSTGCEFWQSGKKSMFKIKRIPLSRNKLIQNKNPCLKNSLIEKNFVDILI